MQVAFTPFVTKTLGITKFDLLVSLYIFCIVTSELMGSKTFPIADLGFMKLNGSVAIFLFPFVFLINDIIAEVYGKARARSVVRSSLIVVFALFCFAIFATALPPSTRSVPTEAAYDTIFGKSIRFAAASLIALAIADVLDLIVFARLRERFGKKSLWLRTNASNILAQLVDTTTFMVLAFYAFDQSFNENAGFLVSIILPYWLLKCGMSLAETPLVYWGVKWLQSDKNDKKE